MKLDLTKPTLSLRKPTLDLQKAPAQSPYKMENGQTVRRVLAKSQALANKTV